MKKNNIRRLCILLAVILVCSICNPITVSVQAQELTDQSISAGVSETETEMESDSQSESSSPESDTESESESIFESENESESAWETELETESNAESESESMTESVGESEDGSNTVQEGEMNSDDPEAYKFYRDSARDDNGLSIYSEVDSKEVKAYGIDVSQWNGDIDWKKVKNAGVDFVIIRVAYRGYGTGKIVTDPKAIQNLKGAQDAGLQIGAYFFSTAINETEAIEEADYLINIIKDYNITYPIAYDCEGYESSDYRNHNLTVTQRSNNAIAFLSWVEALGYKGMMYGSKSYLQSDQHWEMDRIGAQFDTWVAQYFYYDDKKNEYPNFESILGRTTTYTGEYSFWQFSSQGSVYGISGGVDLNLEYYPEGTGDNDEEDDKNDSYANLDVTVSEDGDIQVIIKNLKVPYKIQSISMPVWTEKNGQDDIIWYDAVQSGDTWIVNVDPRNHNSETGKYELHLYCADETGKWNFVVSDTAQVTSVDKSDIHITDVGDGRFSVSINASLIPSSAQNVTIPVWTQKNGQDDIVWHNAVKNGDVWIATINAVSHKNESGKYEVHAYYAGTNGSWNFVDSTTVNVTAKNTVLRIEDGTNGKIIVYLSASAVPSKAGSVAFPVWSVENGQDDIIWYAAAKSGSWWVAEINPGNHKNVSGTYEIHAYYANTRGQWNLIESTTKNVIANENALMMTVVKSGTSSISVTVRNIDGIKNASSIAIPVWSEKNGQDDIVWYTPSQNGDTLTLTINTANHRGDKGKYEIHLYYTDRNGKWCFVSSTSIQI